MTAKRPKPVFAPFRAADFARANSTTPAADPRKDALVFQWMDMETQSSPQPLKENPRAGFAVPGSKEGPVPTIRIFGVDEGGRSVCVNVFGVTPYLYVDPPGPEFDNTHCGAYRLALEAAVAATKRGSKEIKTHVLLVNVVRRQSILGYGPSSRNVLQVFLSAPQLVATARTVLERGFRCPGFPERQFQTYESNVPFELRYMIDNDIVGCNWLELPAQTFAVVERPATRCQAEYNVVYDNIISHSPSSSPQWGRVAPLCVLSFDIECMGRKGFFPDPKLDPVIQIANYISVQGETEPRCKVVFVLNTCSPIVGSTVLCFETEQALLLAWSEFVRATDPDVLTGYNIQNFDVPYLLNRAKALKIDNQFEHLGRVLGSRATMKNTTFSSAAHGTRESVDTTIDGRIMMDMIQYMYRNQKLSSYSLNAVSAEFLGMQKEDVHHSIISDLHQGSDDDRRRLAVYCLRDAYLPQQLMNKLLVMVNNVEMARVTGVPMPYLFSRGQQIKVLSMLYRKARSHNMVIPVLPRAQGQEGGDDVGYEGATVIEPKKGFYQVPVATLDFASLYPSIMRAHNLCYTTLLSAEDAERMPEEDKERSPCGHWFVKPHVRKGLLPIILEELLNARSRAKKDMKNATDPFERDVMNGRQLALKVSANSVYGFTGATVGALPCIPISSSVTSYGREMIEATRLAVEEHYTLANGYQANAEVIYGDTDSVMVKFGCSTVAEAMRLGLEAAQRVTKIFPEPVSLEFEKVYFPYLLIAKKRYAGLYWTKAEKFDKMDCKGIETVRRDNCQLVRTLLDTCLRKILIEQDVQGAIAYTKQTIAALLQNKVDISLLIISKSLSGDADEYKNKQPHVELAVRMKKRDPGSAPVTGDRVPYVIVQAAKNTPLYEKSEDPLYALEHNIPIDFSYYLEHQLSNPLVRLFEAIIPDPNSLLSGDHTRTVYKATPTTKTGLMRFAVRQLKCLGCKTPLEDETNSLCANCEERRAEIYLEHLAVVKEREVRFSELWTQCQRCQGSLHQDVLCSSGDCPIFYQRKKVQKDLKEAQDALDRFAF